MLVRILGQLEVFTGAGARLDLGTPKQRTVCALLVTRANQLVTVEHLVDELWPDSPPPSAVANARTYAANLRRLFRAANFVGLGLDSRGAGYVLRIEPDQLDMLVFRDLLRQARGEVNRGNLAAAADDLDRALALWGGQPLEDVVAGPLLAARRAVLCEEHAAAVEDRSEVLLALGRERAAVPLLREHLPTHPTRERGWELLMSALYRTGDVAGALTAYTEARAALIEKLGVEPGAKLRKLQQMVLRGENARPVSPASPLPASAGEPRPPPSSRCLPRPISDFTGRDELVVRLVNELDPGNPVLVAIDGMAGAGKTTLAVHVAARVADRYPDGHLYLDLHGHSESAPVAPAAALNLLLGQLGLPTTQVPAGLEERVARWRTEVAHRRLLILLDNAADSRQVAPLIPGTSRSAVMVTSRSRLTGLHDARHISLDLLQPIESVRLLARIAGEAAVSADPDATAEVALLCGHLPLALRIAGARLASRSSWTVADLAERLRAANPAMVDLAVEGRSVAAALALSYRNLPPPVRRMFRLLGQHPGIDFDENAAAAMADLNPAAARDLLEELVDVHLLEQPAKGHYRLHDLLRDFALHLADPADATDGDAGLARLVDYELHTLVNASRWLIRYLVLRKTDWGPASPHALTFASHEEALPWLTAEWRNALAVARQALEKGWYQKACLLGLAMWPWMFRRGYSEHLIDLQEGVAGSAPRSGDRYLEGLNHHYLAGAYGRLLMRNKSIYHLERALAVWREHGDLEAEVASLNNYVIVLCHSGRFQEAVEHGQKAVQMAEAVGDEATLVRAHHVLATACRMLGEYDGALRHLRYAGTRYWSMKDVSLYPSCLAELGQVHGRLGHLTVANALLTRAEDRRRKPARRSGGVE